MCKLLAELTGIDKQVMKEMILRLEQTSGEPGVDLRLTGEIYGSLHMKLRGLGLDPHDTTPRELYHSLRNLAVLHDGFLAQKLGANEPTNPAVIFPLVERLIGRMGSPKNAWTMKPVAAKRLLKAIPPKQLMKALHYRSNDSLLKRESPLLVLAVARHIEPTSWQHKFTESYKKLRSSDFENRDITVTYLAEGHWQHVGKAYALSNHTPILHAPEAGAIAILPLATNDLPGITLLSLMLVLHYINEIRSQSNYWKLHHLQPDFGKRLIRDVIAPPASHHTLAGQPIHWRVIHHYYGSRAISQHPEVFQPHVQPEDMAYRKAEHTLFHLEPALHFWHDTDYVGLPQADGVPVSFNLMDVAVNLVNGLSYENRLAYHSREAVWNELYRRYLGQPAIERQLLKQLDERISGASMIGGEMEFSL